MSVTEDESQALDDQDESRLVDIWAFGHRFPTYPSALAKDLVSLEREGVVYAEFADDIRGPDENGLWEFHPYRIALHPHEIVQYVEAAVAYQEFIEAQAQGADFDQALDAVSAPEIADRVRSYHGGEAELEDGTVIDNRGCPASFYPDGMESLLCGGERHRYEELPGPGEARDQLAQLVQVLNSFVLAARLLGDRQRGRPAFVIENEYDVQDLLYALIRCSFDDARREEWTPQRAGSAKRIDITVPSIEAVIETKFVRDGKHSKRIADELRIDFECYHDRPECKHLFALVIDPSRFITDPDQFGSDLSGLRRKADHSFDVSVLVR